MFVNNTVSWLQTNWNRNWCSRQREPKFQDPVRNRDRQTPNSNSGEGLDPLAMCEDYSRQLLLSSRCWHKLAVSWNISVCYYTDLGPVTLLFWSDVHADHMYVHADRMYVHADHMYVHVDHMYVHADRMSSSSFSCCHVGHASPHSYFVDIIMYVNNLRFSIVLK